MNTYKVYGVAQPTLRSRPARSCSTSPGGPNHGRGGCAGTKWAEEEEENEKYRDLADELLVGLFGLPKSGLYDREDHNHAAAYCEHHPIDCSYIYRAADEASAEAKRVFPNSRKRENAFRHAYWMALLTRNGIPIENAMTFAAGHELDGDIEYRTNDGWGSDESRTDMHNNRVGSQIGATVKVDRLTPKPIRAPKDDRPILSPLIQAAIYDGRLDVTGT